MIRRLLGAMGLSAGPGSMLAGPVLGSFVLRGAGMVPSFLLGVQLAHYLAPEGLGIYGVVISVALLLSVAAQAGLPTLATREIAVGVSREQWARVHGVLRWFGIAVILFSLIIAAGLLGATHLWARATGWTGDREVQLGAILIPAFALTVLVGAELRGFDRIVAGQSFEILMRPLLTCVFCFVLFEAAGQLSPAEAIGANAASSVLALAAGFVLLWRTAPRMVWDARAPRAPREWARGAVPLGITDLLRQLDATYGMVILGLVAPAAQAGFMRIALSMIYFVVTPLSVFHVALAPTLARFADADDRNGLRRISRVAAACMFATSVAVLALLLLAGAPIISFLFGRDFAPALWPLLLLTLAQCINGFFGVGWVLLSMSGGERPLTRSYAISVPLSVAVAAPATYQWGATGAAFAAVVGALVQGTYVWHSVRRRWHVDCSLLSLLPAMRSESGASRGDRPRLP